MIKRADTILRGTPADRPKRAGVVLTDDGRTVSAYVNHGRWVADCPNCNGGIACDPSQPAVCYDCGHIYELSWPDDADTAETVLARRDIVHQNWYPHLETVTDLKAENLRHGLRV